MAARMIRVRNKETGQVTTVAERAFKHFAGYFERVDQPADKPAEKAPQAPAPAVEPTQSKPSSVRRAAASNDKE